MNLFKIIGECNEQVIASSIEHSEQVIANYRDQIISDVDIPNDSTYLNTLLDSLNSKLSNAVEKFKDNALGKAKSIPSRILEIESKITIIDESLKPLLKKVTDKEALELSDKNLKIEEGKLRNIEEIEKKKESIKKQDIECKDEIKQQYKNLSEHYMNYVTEIAKPDYQFEEDIKITAEVAFDEDKFNEFVSSFDMRGNMSSLLGSLVNTAGEFNFNIDIHSDKVATIHDNFGKKSDIPSVRKGIADIDVIKKLYADCFYVNFVVQYKDDDIVRMSPGKRGLVLLNLILHLSNSSHPILIDQPEDNLDNRTIYDQLNEFIRLRKIKRQIIMVTHNANLVVAADSECVIVANQAGQQANIENEQFKFEYCSGSLECSFEDNSKLGTLKSKGIRQHVCEILEGGVSAFKERELKYGLKA